MSKQKGVSRYAPANPLISYLLDVCITLLDRVLSMLTQLNNILDMVRMWEHIDRLNGQNLIHIA